ncbi:MAG: hypothetical protein ACJAX7_002259 [Saprospiraceae bacterium]|jgi:hypothetical protein
MFLRIIISILFIIMDNILELYNFVSESILRGTPKVFEFAKKKNKTKRKSYILHHLLSSVMKV